MQESSIIQEFSRRGRERGLQEGTKQGIRLGKNSVLLKQIEAKFGNLPISLIDQIRAIDDIDELDRLCLKVLTANSIDEMEIPTPKN